ncbi:hypothetical protein Tco_1406681 [Tanacetum coccineum]
MVRRLLSLLQVLKRRFGGNTATKKTQKNLLKQQYENFAASSTEVEVSTATDEDTLQGSAGHPRIKTTGIGSLPEGLC